MKIEERLRRFELCGEQFKAQGYAVRDCTFAIGRGTAVMLLTALPFAVVAVILYIFLTDAYLVLWSEWLIFIVAVIVGIPMHELLHALGWAAVNRSFKGIRLGFQRNTLTPYCACSIPMNRMKYVFGVLLPFGVLGLLSSVFSIIFAKFWLLLFALCNIFMAGGDTAVTFKALFYAPKGALLLDHPERAGFFAFYKKD